MAGSVEELLRARFCAYNLKNAEYIADTTHPESKEYTGVYTVLLSLHLCVCRPSLHLCVYHPYTCMRACVCVCVPHCRVSDQLCRDSQGEVSRGGRAGRGHRV